MRLFNKILVANRGEIALRINRAAKDLGISTVAIYSENDASSMHADMTHEAYNLGGGELTETYLNSDKIVRIAKQSGCDAIHPGYGFLAENPRFVSETEKSGLTFIGPSADVMALMGNKIQARDFISKIGIPLVGGAVGKTVESLMEAAKTIRYPLLLKAAGGGGGKGMRVVKEKTELANALESTQREALSYFGDGTIYIEQYLEDPRHIEIQVMGDHHGNVVHVFERECSIQRRYQKIIEEAPSPTLTPEIRQEMGNAAVKICKEIGYNNAGTIEFLVDKDLNFYFLEMNTRIQVEHPVTEMTTGIDLVREQILVGAGNPLSIRQDEIKQTGHAIEARIYAEDPANNFLPSPGSMTCYSEPYGENIRIDSSTDKVTEIKSYFDPMISKLIVFGKDRKEATHKLDKALADYIIHGIKTNIPYLRGLIRSKDFINNQISTTYCDRETPKILKQVDKEKEKTDLHIPLLSFIALSFIPRVSRSYPSRSNEINIWEYMGYWRSKMSLQIIMDGVENEITVRKSNYPLIVTEISGKEYQVRIIGYLKNRMVIKIDQRQYECWISECSKTKTCVSYCGYQYELERKDRLHEEIEYHLDEGTVIDSDVLTSPMPGKVIKLNSRKGNSVRKGDVVIVIEAMKMENNITAHRDAGIRNIAVKVGDMVEAGVPLVYFEKKDK